MAAGIQVSKNVNQSGEGFDTILYYSLTICNTGDIPFEEVILQDALDPLVGLVPGSLTRDGEPISDTNLAQGVAIGALAVGEWTIVCYAVQLVVGTCGGCVSNQATVTGQYRQAGITASVVGVSNLTYSRIDMECFSQNLMTESLALPDTSTSIESIEYVYPTVNVIDYYTVPTYKGTSYECQVLSGCKVIVSGMINLEVIYTTLTVTQQVQCVSFKIPFFTYVVVPNTVTSTTSLNVEVIIEKVTYEIANSRLIKANILYCTQVKM